MPARTQKKIVLADTEEELEAIAMGDPEIEEPPDEAVPAPPSPEEPAEEDGEAETEVEDDEETAKGPTPHGVAYPNVNDAINGEILADTVRYEARISIVEAWQYNGNVRQAPPWVDHNWIGWSDADPLRGIPSGPCLRFPAATGDVVIVRIGDYLAQQNVQLAEGISDIRVEVWEKSHFEKLFIPKRHRIDA